VGFWGGFLFDRNQIRAPAFICDFIRPQPILSVGFFGVIFYSTTTNFEHQLLFCFFIRPKQNSCGGFCAVVFYSTTNKFEHWILCDFLFDQNQFRVLDFVCDFYSTATKFERWLFVCFFIRPQQNSTKQVKNNISNSNFTR